MNMSEKRFKPYSVPTTDGDGFVIGIQNEDGTVMSIIDASEMLNKQQATIQRFEEYVFSDERILCYNCLFCQEKDIYEVKCKIKGSVDVHGTCQYYEKKR